MAEVVEEGTGLPLGLTRNELTTGAKIAVGAWAFLVFVFVLYPAAISVLLLGAVLGTLSSLVAMGLVLIYRANRIINFAQGDIGGMAGVLAGSLIVGPELPFFVAVGIAFAFVLVIGAGTEILVIRRFNNASRLVLTVATIGLAQLFQVGQLILPQLFDYDTAPQPPRPFDFTFEIDPVVFGPGHLMIVVAVPLIAAGLGLFFNRTRYGIAIRASAESAQRAALLGIPTKYLNTMVWVLATAMSGAGVLLRLPIQGVSIGSVLGPALLLRALAAAVIGRMENLPKTFVAAMGIGVIESAVLFVTGQTLIVDAVLFGIILVVLLFQKAGGDRSKDTGVASWASNKEIRPIPGELKSLPEVRWPLIGGGIIGVFLLLYLPLGFSIKNINLLSVGVIFSMVIVSLVILTGWSGQITLGHLAVVAIGSATAGTLAQSGWNFFFCLFAGAAAGVFISLLLAVPAIRIPGLFFAVTSLAFAIATGTFFLNPRYFGWLVPDPVDPITRQRPILFDKFDMESEYTYYYVCLFFLVFVVAAVSRLRRSRTGRVLVANRENTRAVQSYGVSHIKAQLVAFAVSGGIAGFAGALFFFHQHALSRSILAPNENFILFSIAVVGGLASIPGALLGSAYLTMVKFSGLASAAETQLFASGVGVMFILLVLPTGLGGLLYDTRDRLLRLIANRRGLVVPSLVADVRVDEDDPRDARERKPAEVSEPSDNPKILVRDLELAYGKTQILFGVDFHVEPGEVVALLGTNGAGKSTLLNGITGLAKPFAGTVLLDGKDITGKDPTEIVRERLVMMPGGKGVFPTLTVEENLRLAGWIHGDDPEWVAHATEDVLNRFPRLRERLDQRAGNLSGGEQQMLTLGQALIMKPEVLAIDELSLGLAPVIVEQLLEIVREINAQGTTIIVVEQSVNVAITIADRAVFMEKGEVRFDGPTADLLDRPEILRAVFLQGAGAKDDLDAPTPEEVIDAAREEGDDAGEDTTLIPAVATVATKTDPADYGEELLRVDGLAVSFGGVQAVRDATFDLKRRQIVGLIGANGAGKTTTFDLISGFVTPTAGRVFLSGTDVTDVSPAGRAILGLGRSFQDARLFSAMTVRETISTALDRHVKVRDPIASLVLSSSVKFSEREVAAQAEELIELMNLTAFADKFVGELSTGSRRIVDLACCLAHKPDVLMLDEPSSGIAQRETEALGPVLFDIRDKLDCGIVIIEHDMPLITAVSNELVALELGAVIVRGEPEEVITHPRVVEGYLGQTDVVNKRSGASA